jgi:hypothetical protein
MLASRSSHAALRAATRIVLARWLSVHWNGPCLPALAHTFVPPPLAAAPQLVDLHNAGEYRTALQQ